MSKKPNFFIVGAPKCGTTSLHGYLEDHPLVFVCNPKEPGYFAKDFPGSQVVKTKENYLNLFEKASKNHKAKGESSTVYLYSKRALKEIHAFDSKAKIN